MALSSDKRKALFNIFLLAWPLAKAVLLFLDVDLPDLNGVGDALGIGSQAVGTIGLARSPALGDKRGV